MMYDWLTRALRDSGQVVTANQRLARALTEAFAEQQIAAGHLAWRSPIIRSWSIWLPDLLASAEPADDLPTRITAQQSRVLWERCLRREITDPLLNVALLVRQARDSWARLHEFRVPLAACKAAASGRDQRLFARAASSYQSILLREHWVDDACLSRLVTDLITAGQVRLPVSATFAGFDRLSPQVAALMAALADKGVRIDLPTEAEPGYEGAIHIYENSESELRAAGAWARDQLEVESTQTIAIVATGLE
ncbi:MAG: hypothetical protein OEM51_07815, partial [Gammaproteobacteria bacterium]|nr:hypothetical protein [Gammaproteobacteria bacterium]